MSARPQVSVVMPLHDKAAEVGAAIGSVLAQTEPDLELIVVDDGSTDGSAEAALAAADPRVLLLRQENRGVAAARNRGVAAASAPLVAFLDADDLWDEDYLATVLLLAREHRDCEVFATSYRLRGPDGRVRPAVLRGGAPAGERFVLEDYFAVAAASDPPLWTCAVAVTRLAIRSVGGFPEGVDSGEDLLTWARLAVRSRIAYCRVPKATFHQPASVEDRRARLPRDADPVGAGLAALEREVPSPTGAQVRAYRALWHRMRASRFLQAGDAPRARGEALRSFRLHPSPAALTLGALALLPGTVSPGAFRAVRRLARAGRAGEAGR